MHTEPNYKQTKFSHEFFGFLLSDTFRAWNETKTWANEFSPRAFPHAVQTPVFPTAPFKGTLWSRDRQNTRPALGNFGLHTFWAEQLAATRSFNHHHPTMYNKYTQEQNNKVRMNKNNCDLGSRMWCVRQENDCRCNWWTSTKWWINGHMFQTGFLKI